MESMTTLHTVNRAELLMLCTAAFVEGDGVLLLEAGVYALLQAEQLPNRCYVLAADAKARGLRLPNQAVAVDYDGFVALCTEFDRVTSW